MSGVHSAWTTTDPERLAAFAEWQAAEDAWRDAIHAFAKSVEPKGERSPMVRHNPSRLAGLTCVSADYNGHTPEGWRVVRKDSVLLPHRTSKAGKVIAAEFDKLKAKHIGDVAVGMPSFTLSSSGFGMAMHHPNVAMLDGRLVCVWGAEPEAVSPVDEAIWQPTKLSEFHALLEAENERRSVDA